MVDDPGEERAFVGLVLAEPRADVFVRPGNDLIDEVRPGPAVRPVQIRADPVVDDMIDYIILVILAFRRALDGRKDLLLCV